MADANTTKSDITGIIRDMWSDILADYQTLAELQNAVNTQDASNSGSVKFPRVTLPTAATEHTEAGTGADTREVSIDYVEATPGAFRATIMVTQESLDRAIVGLPNEISKQLGGALALGADGEIAGLATSFQNIVGSIAQGYDLTVKDMLKAQAILYDSKIKGSIFSCFMHMGQYVQLLSDVGNLFVPATQEQILQLGPGFRGVLAGIGNIFTSNSVTVTDAGTHKYATGLLMYKDYAIGHAWDGQLKGVEQEYIHTGTEAHRRKITAWTNLDAKELNDSCGVRIVSDVTDYLNVSA